MFEHTNTRGVSLSAKQQMMKPYLDSVEQKINRLQELREKLFEDEAFIFVSSLHRQARLRALWRR
jgi:hypothetical protein